MWVASMETLAVYACVVALLCLRWSSRRTRKFESVQPATPFNCDCAGLSHTFPQDKIDAQFSCPRFQRCQLGPLAVRLFYGIMYMVSAVLTSSRSDALMHARAVGKNSPLWLAINRRALPHNIFITVRTQPLDPAGRLTSAGLDPTDIKETTGAHTNGLRDSVLRGYQHPCTCRKAIFHMLCGQATRATKAGTSDTSLPAALVDALTEQCLLLISTHLAVPPMVHMPWRSCFVSVRSTNQTQVGGDERHSRPQRSWRITHTSLVGQKPRHDDPGIEEAGCKEPQPRQEEGRDRGAGLGLLH